MLLKEATEQLNIIMNEINETVGEKILNEFLSCCTQPMVLQSRIEVVAEVNIDFKEATGHRAKEIVIERAAKVCDEIIDQLTYTRNKLARL